MIVWIVWLIVFLQGCLLSWTQSELVALMFGWCLGCAIIVTVTEWRSR